MNLPGINQDIQAAVALRSLPRLLGLLLALEMVQLWDDLPLLYGPDGLIDPALLQLRQPPIGWGLHDLTDALPYMQTIAVPTIHLLALVYIGLCLALVFALQVRLSSLLLLILHQVLFIADPNWAYGVDYLVQTGLFLCCVFYPSLRSCTAPSFWCKTGLFALQGQLTLVYFFGGWSKAMGSSWYTGEAIWKAVQQSYPGTAIPIAVHWGSAPYLWMMAGWLVMLIELAYPLIWLGRRTCSIILIIICGLHVGIALTMGLYHFALIMIWYNYCAWHIPYNTLTKSIYSPLEDSSDNAASSKEAAVTSIQGKGEL